MFGSPLSRVRAPTLFSTYFESAEKDAVLVPMEVTDDYVDFARRVFRSPNVAGAMVTFPYKRSTELLDAWSPAVDVVQAVNAIVKREDGSLYGDIFDGVGFVNGLKRAGFSYAGAQCLIVGSGGAGAAVAVALVDAGISRLAIQSRNEDAVAALVTRLSKYAQGMAVKIEGVHEQAGDYDIVINATPLGMQAYDPLPFDMSLVRPGAIVADLVMGEQTRLLREAAAAGCSVQPGTKMLFEQLSPVLQFWGFDAVPWQTVEDLKARLGW